MASPTSPGRPRTFDEGDLLDRSIDLFWENGLAGTTTRVLEHELQISQSSLYNAFGSKDELLDQVIGRYEARLNEAVLQKLRSPGREALTSFLDAVLDWISEDQHRGCLILNLASEDRGHAHRLKVYRRRLRRSIKPPIRSFTSDPATVDERTEVLVAAVLGLNLSATTGATAPELTRMAAAIKNQIASW